MTSISEGWLLVAFILACVVARAILGTGMLPAMVFTFIGGIFGIMLGEIGADKR